MNLAADVVIQLIMQYCTSKEIISLTQSSRKLNKNSQHKFSWKHCGAIALDINKTNYKNSGILPKLSKYVSVKVKCNTSDIHWVRNIPKLSTLVFEDESQDLIEFLLHSNDIPMDNLSTLQILTEEYDKKKAQEGIPVNIFENCFQKMNMLQYLTISYINVSQLKALSSLPQLIYLELIVEYDGNDYEQGLLSQAQICLHRGIMCGLTNCKILKTLHINAQSNCPKVTMSIADRKKEEKEKQEICINFNHLQLTNISIICEIQDQLQEWSSMCFKVLTMHNCRGIGNDNHLLQALSLINGLSKINITSEKSSHHRQHDYFSIDRLYKNVNQITKPNHDQVCIQKHILLDFKNWMEFACGITTTSGYYAPPPKYYFKWIEYIRDMESQLTEIF